MELKPFDLEKALAGDKVVTKNGRQVSQLHLFECNNEFQYPLLGVIDDNITASFKNGKNFLDHDSNDDLFMAPKTKKLWIAISKSTDFITDNRLFHATTSAYPSLDLLHASTTIFAKDNWIIKEIEIEI